MDPEFFQRLLKNPIFLFVSGLIATVGGLAGEFFCYRDLKRYPKAPEPMTLAAAIERADRGEEPWVKVSAPYVACSRSFTDDGYVHVPISRDPLVLVQFERPKYFDCTRVDRTGIVGVIDRAPSRYAQHLFGDSSRVFYRLCTWSGPDNDRIGIKVCLAFMGAGVLLLGFAAYYKRRTAAG